MRGARTVAWGWPPIHGCRERSGVGCEVQDRPRSVASLLASRARPRRGRKARSMQAERNEPSLRVVIADDHALLLQGLASMLEAHGFDVVAQAGDADDLIRKVGAHEPDAAVIDIRMPPTHTDDGLRAAVAIREAHPDGGRARALASTSRPLRARADRRRRARRRLPAQGPGRRLRRVRRRRAARGRRRLRAGPRGGARMLGRTARRGPARRADRRASARCWR